jgi:hypothetical protein
MSGHDDPGLRTLAAAAERVDAGSTQLVRPFAAAELASATTDR